jgi:hypothetical protein
MSLEDVHSEIERLKRRIDVLEKTRGRPRGKTNQTGAARYLGISEETLRQRHARGIGPPRKRAGPRQWEYDFGDLDSYEYEDPA